LNLMPGAQYSINHYYGDDDEGLIAFYHLCIAPGLTGLSRRKWRDFYFDKQND
jgi:hypothetical protein